MPRRHALILLLTAALVAGCTSPTAPTASHDEQITIGPHPDVVVGGGAVRGQ